MKFLLLRSEAKTTTQKEKNKRKKEKRKERARRCLQDGDLSTILMDSLHGKDDQKAMKQDEDSTSNPTTSAASGLINTDKYSLTLKFIRRFFFIDSFFY